MVLSSTFLVKLLDASLVILLTELFNLLCFMWYSTVELLWLNNLVLLKLQWRSFWMKMMFLASVFQLLVKNVEETRISINTFYVIAIIRVVIRIVMQVKRSNSLSWECLNERIFKICSQTLFSPQGHLHQTRDTVSFAAENKIIRISGRRGRQLMDPQIKVHFRASLNSRGKHITT